MKTIHQTYRRFIAFTVLVLPTLASAHPGPPGHTHEGDDWPFDPIGLVILGIVVGAGLVIWKRRKFIKLAKSSAQERRIS